VPLAILISGIYVWWQVGEEQKWGELDQEADKSFQNWQAKNYNLSEQTIAALRYERDILQNQLQKQLKAYDELYALSHQKLNDLGAQYVKTLRMQQMQPQQQQQDKTRQYDREQPEQFKKTYSSLELFDTDKTIYEGQQENGGRWVRGNRNILGAPEWQWISEEEYQDRLRQQEQLIRNSQQQQIIYRLQQQEQELQDIKYKLK
jgi:hypothetical protein